MKKYPYSRDLEYYQKRWDLFQSRIPAEWWHGNVLDLGCGDGGMIARIKESYPSLKVYGAEIDPAGCKLAAGVADGVKQADFNQKLPFHSNQFDLVFSQEVIEHILDPDMCLSEIKRVLKPGGRAIITTPNLLAWHQRILCLLGIMPSFYEVSTKHKDVGLGFMKSVLKETKVVGHIRVFTPAALTDLASRYGLTVVRVEGLPIEYAFPEPVKSIFHLLDSFFSRIPGLQSNILLLVQNEK